MSDSKLQTLKKDLRKRVRDAMRALSLSQRSNEETIVTNLATTHLQQHPTGTLLAYAAFPPELNIDPVITSALNHGWRVALPLITSISRRTMELHHIESLNNLVHGPMGIRQPSPELTTKTDPAEIDIALIPAWAFDRKFGARLGKGAGFYDRLLATSSWRAKSYGIAFRCQLVDDLPVEPHDMHVNGIFTPDGLLRPL